MLKSFAQKSFTLAVAAISVLSLSGVATASWSPERPTFTTQEPAPYVTFNSITDNQSYGDERRFFDAKDARNTSRGGFSEQVRITEQNQEFILRMYVHNNAASNLNTVPNGNGGFVGVAENTRVRIHLPTATDAALRANAYISASNAMPREVADTVDFVGADGKNFQLEYVQGSAKAYTNAVPAGYALSNDIVTTGAPFGHTGPNGTVPGCFEFDGFVEVRVRAKLPQYTIQKEVRMAGTGPGNWAESVEAKPGDRLEWQIHFKNNGETTLSDVLIADQIPAGLNVVPGSVKLVNGSTGVAGYTYPASAIQRDGREVHANIGTYNPGIDGKLLFTTEVVAADQLECGVNEIVNRGFATPKGFAAVSDTASLTVENGVCAEAKPTTPTPTVLPNTGPGAVFGIASATTVAGTMIHRYVSVRRYGKSL